MSTGAVNSTVIASNLMMFDVAMKVVHIHFECVGLRQKKV